MPWTTTITILLVVNISFVFGYEIVGMYNGEQCIMVSKGKPATQSSDYTPESVAANGNDGEQIQWWGRQTKWGQPSFCTQTKQEVKPWWRVDLISTYKIRLVKVWNRGDCCGERLASLEIQTSSDDKTWSACATLEGPAGDFDINTFQCSATARYVRLQLMKPVAEHLTVCEVEVIACDANSMFEEGRITIPMKGTLFWKLIFEYDNSNNKAKITREFKTKVVKKFSHKLVRKALNENKSNTKTSHEASASVEASYMAVKGSLSYKGSYANEIASLTTGAEDSEDQQEYTEETEDTQKYEINPDSKLSLYQLCFKSKGITYEGRTLSTVAHPDEEVEFSMEAEPIQFVGNIEVEYRRSQMDAPENHIRELNPTTSAGSDVNFNFGGRYVYLVAKYTINVKEALTGVEAIIQNEWNSNGVDLAVDAGGKYRYLKPVRDSREAEKIHEIMLWRTTSDTTTPPKGFDGMSTNINAGRGGDNKLYLIWKTMSSE